METKSQKVGETLAELISWSKEPVKHVDHVEPVEPEGPAKHEEPKKTSKNQTDPLRTYKNLLEPPEKCFLYCQSFSTTQQFGGGSSSLGVIGLRIVKSEEQNI